MIVSEFVAGDIGASNTRYVSNNGKIGILPNNMVFLDMDTRVDMEPYSNDIESALEVIIECDGDSKFFPVRVLIGDMANRYSSTNVRPSVIANKHTQQINYVSIVTAVAISRLNGIKDVVSLYLALPPMEVKTAKDVVKEQLERKFTVRLPKYKNSVVEFTINEVNCYEESFMSMLSYFFEMNGALKESAKKYSHGNILSLDIGASTTDLAIVSDMRYLEKSGQTYKTGGNVARDFLIDDLRAVYGYDVPHDIADIVMAEGRIQVGDGYDDVSSIVSSSKQRFAAQIVEQIQGYFRKVNIPIQSIRAIIVSGGGSMRSEYVDDTGNIIVTSEPMSHYITQELNKVCPGVKVEHYGNNPRLANIAGLFIRANIDIRRKIAADNNK